MPRSCWLSALKASSVPTAYPADSRKAFCEVCNNAIIEKYCVHKRYNTNCRADPAGWLCFQMKNANFRQADGLHNKVVWRIAEKSGADCRKG